MSCVHTLGENYERVEGDKVRKKLVRLARRKPLASQMDNKVRKIYSPFLVLHSEFIFSFSLRLS